MTDQERRPDSSAAPIADARRGGPVALAEASDEDRAIVEQLQADERARRDRELEAQIAATEPSGVLPSDEQRQAVLDATQKSADSRAGAARARRRTPQAIGEADDPDRELVAQLQAEERERREDALSSRGIVNPTVAGFGAELPHLPGHELYGYFKCPTCGAQVERSFPGYVDWDALSRELHCPECGGLVKQGTAAPTNEAGPLTEPPPDADPRDAGPQGPASSPTPTAPAPSSPSPAAALEGQTIQTSTPAPAAETVTRGPYTELSGAERAELEQLRAEAAARRAAGQPTEQTSG